MQPVKAGALYCFLLFVFQDTHNQAGIAHNGGLAPLLNLLDSKNGSLQHNAAFALFGLTDNEVLLKHAIFFMLMYCSVLSLGAVFSCNVTLQFLWKNAECKSFVSITSGLGA